MIGKFFACVFLSFMSVAGHASTSGVMHSRGYRLMAVIPHLSVEFRKHMVDTRLETNLFVPKDDAKI